MALSAVNLSIQLEYADYQGESAPKSKSFYKPGDTMDGTVVMTLNSAVRVCNLNVEAIGQAETAWHLQDKKKMYSAQEMYLAHNEPLLSPHGGLGILFPKGVHRFAFRFNLPVNLPSSFNGTYGNVTYVVHAKLEAEDDLKDSSVSMPFLVLRRDPLPPIAYQPLKNTKSKLMGITFGKMKVWCSLDHGIVVPGQHINVNAEVFNWSDKDITMLQGALVMDATYRTKEQREISFRQYLAKREDVFDVNLKWGRRWTDVKIRIPPYLPDSGLRFCHIIDVAYSFEYRVQIKGQDDIVVRLPVYVGYHDEGFATDPKDMLMDRMFMETPRSMADVGRSASFGDIRAPTSFSERGMTREFGLNEGSRYVRDYGVMDGYRNGGDLGHSGRSVREIEAFESYRPVPIAKEFEGMDSYRPVRIANEFEGIESYRPVRIANEFEGIESYRPVPIANEFEGIESYRPIPLAIESGGYDYSLANQRESNGIYETSIRGPTVFTDNTRPTNYGDFGKSRFRNEGRGFSFISESRRPSEYEDGRELNDARGFVASTREEPQGLPVTPLSVAPKSEAGWTVYRG